MKTETSFAKAWLWLGVTALALAGVFAIILVVARTPQLAALTVFQQLFSVALVVHVDLSVLMWFVAMLGLGSTLLLEHQGHSLIWTKAGFYTIAAATALMALSPVDPHWEVVKSNYIPVLENRVFLLSLGLLSAGLLALLLPVVRCVASLRGAPVVLAGVTASALTGLLALAAFFISGYLMPQGLAHEVRYERLFWAGGHILQFTFSLLMMAAWLALLEAMDAVALARRGVLAAYGLMVLGACASFAGVFIHPFDSDAFTLHQTRIMIEAGGLGAGLLLAMVVWRLLKTPRFRTRRAYFSTLLMSLIVFSAGSLLGVLITGQNVTIPAHYHGMIVGITLALMGFAYTLLPRFGYQSVAGTRLAFWQPIVYGVGQLMHIGGLGYSGGYGVLRKTPGAIEGIGLNVKIALGIMGFGGLLAIIGGLLFVVVMVRVRRK